MKALPDERLSSTARHILGYLRKHKDAQDTIEGIAEWWLLEQRIRIVITEVRKALAELVDQGLVLDRKGQDGRVHYRLNQRKHRGAVRAAGKLSSLRRQQRTEPAGKAAKDRK